MSAKSRTVKSETPTMSGHMEISIEKGIAIPASVRTKNKYPFEQLSSGDSFVVRKKTSGTSVTVAYWKKKLPGRDFTVRAISEQELKDLKIKGKLPEETVAASRVWRTDGMKEKV